MAAEFPETRSLGAAFRAARPADSESVQPLVPARTRIPWGTLNAAIDHRLRYAFRDTEELPETVSLVMRKVGLLTDPTSGTAIRRAGLGLGDLLAELVRAHRPASRSQPLLLPRSVEADLTRLCYAVVWFEEVYRTGRLWPGTPLGDAGPGLTVASEVISQKSDWTSSL
jgi:hypothetical protein